MTTQSVNETPEVEPPQVSTEEVVAQEPDLDSLLAEYDQPAETPVETPTEAPAVTAEVAEMRQLLAEARQNKVNAGLTEAAGFGKKFAGEMVPVDEASTKSWEAVSAAVHSSSTTTPKPAEEITSKTLRNMSNAEFAAHQKKMGFKR
jgi:hypothetical protein